MVFAPKWPRSAVSTSAGAAIGGAVGPRRIHRCLGVFKAYQTRVGNGPFPSEMVNADDEKLADRLRELGHEYGVTTGRPRRVGFLDLTALKYSSWINSLDGFILSHLNLYDGFESIGVCTAYELDGETIHHFPANTADLERLKPVIEYRPGWEGSVAAARKWEDMPQGAADFVRFIEEFTAVPVTGFSVGPLRDETFMRENPWIPS